MSQIPGKIAYKGGNEGQFNTSPHPPQIIDNCTKYPPNFHIRGQFRVILVQYFTPIRIYGGNLGSSRVEGGHTRNTNHHDAILIKLHVRLTIFTNL